MSNYNSRPVFQTSRLRLRKIEPGDGEFLAALDCDTEVMEYIHTGALTPETAKKWAYVAVEMEASRRSMHKWMVEIADPAPGGGERTKIGWVEISRFRGVFDPAENRRSDDISIGYQFARAYWRQGLAFEAVKPVLAYAFETMELDRMVAFVRPGNERSAHLLERLGFVQHPTRRHLDESRQACLLYSLIGPRRLTLK